MNLREGSIGLQESISIVAIAVFIDGVFASHTQSLYQYGNSSYLSVLLSVGLSLGVFLLTLGAMKKTGEKHLTELLYFAFGPVGKLLVGLVLVSILILAAGAPTGRFLLMFSRFVFVEENNWRIMIYMVTAIVVLAWMGMEAIARTARILIWVLLGSVIVALIMAFPGYEWYRLEPVLGNGTGDILLQSLRGTYRFFAPLCSWLCLTKSAQKLEFTRKTGVYATASAGIFSSIVQFCLGLTYPYYELSVMHSPMYRITTMAEESSFQRLDVLLLFFWLVGSLLGAAFHTFAAALLFVRLFGQSDIRPAVVSVGIVMTMLALMGQFNIPWFENFGAFMADYGWIFMLLPFIAASIIAYIKTSIKDGKGMNRIEKG